MLLAKDSAQGLGWFRAVSPVQIFMVGTLRTICRDHSTCCRVRAFPENKSWTSVLCFASGEHCNCHGERRAVFPARVMLHGVRSR